MGYVSMADPNRIIPLNRKNLPVEHTEWPISFQFCSIYILMSLKLIVVDACFFFLFNFICKTHGYIHHLQNRLFTLLTILNYGTVTLSYISVTHSLIHTFTYKNHTTKSHIVEPNIFLVNVLIFTFPIFP